LQRKIGVRKKKEEEKRGKDKDGKRDEKEK
jgi:hypothetical protein